MSTLRTLPIAMLAAALAVPSGATAQESVVDVLRADGNFTTLVSAIEAAGLTDALSGEGPYTIFAPTDEAFAKLPDGKLQELLGEPETLAAILRGHVVQDEVRSSAVTAESTTLTALGGEQLLVTLEDGSVVVQPAPSPAQEVMAGEEAGAQGTVAKVQRADLSASNGVIHAIDTVLIFK